MSSVRASLPYPDEDQPPIDLRTRRVAQAFRGVMEALDLDLSDPNLADTPLRVARLYRELFAGLDPDNQPELRTFPDPAGGARVVAVSDIRFYSLCAHHFLPFFGTAQVAYVPDGRVVGLSKLARVVEFHAHRPQIQERLTEEISDDLDRRLRPAGVMVVLEARHLCMEARGVGQSASRTTTRAWRGAFEQERLRRELRRR
jgi:GTP cyclohydrolase I